MKISELEDAPAWLVEAKTENADVVMRDGLIVWLGGEWLGGYAYTKNPPTGGEGKT